MAYLEGAAVFGKEEIVQKLVHLQESVATERQIVAIRRRKAPVAEFPELDAGEALPSTSTPNLASESTRGARCRASHLK